MLDGEDITIDELIRRMRELAEEEAREKQKQQ